MFAGAECLALNLGDDRGVTVGVAVVDHAGQEPVTDDRVVREDLLVAEASFRDQQYRPRGSARATRRPVGLTVTRPDGMSMMTSVSPSGSAFTRTVAPVISGTPEITNRNGSPAV
jgi:hypothetical protein